MNGPINLANILTDDTIIIGAIGIAATLGLVLGATAGWWLRGRKISRVIATRTIEPGSDNDADWTEGSDSMQSDMDETCSSPACNGHAEGSPLAPAKVNLRDFRTDSLTGLPNRTAFCEDIRRRLSESQRHGNRLSLMLVRIDNLDELESQHDTETRLLVVRTCARFLCAATREMDLVARYGEDTFGILLPSTALVNAARVGERLRGAIEYYTVKLAAGSIQFTASIGVDEAQPSEDLGSLLARADLAQQASLASGGNRVHYHTGTAVEVYGQVAVPAGESRALPAMSL